MDWGRNRRLKYEDIKFGANVERNVVKGSAPFTIASSSPAPANLGIIDRFVYGIEAQAGSIVIQETPPLSINGGSVGNIFCHHHGTEIKDPACLSCLVPHLSLVYDSSSRWSMVIRLTLFNFSSKKDGLDRAETHGVNE